MGATCGHTTTGITGETKGCTEESDTETTGETKGNGGGGMKAEREEENKD